MPYFADMVSETAGAPALGNITLTGAVSGYRTFAAGLGSSSQRTVIRIYDGSGNWEVTKATFNGTTTLVRDGFRASSTGSQVNFASAVTVDIVPSAELVDNANIGSISAQARGLAMR